ncbi:MAG: alkaline phosphatase family protein [Pseudomonadota bacterium]
MKQLLSTLLATLLLVACGASEPPERVVIVLGFDGMDPNLAARWMDEGLLPNFARLRDEGHFGPLATSNPPQSPVAWSAFATGLPAGQHGIYDFLRRDPTTHSAAYAISETRPPKTLNVFGLKVPYTGGALVNRRQGEPFWTRAEAQGHQTTTLRVPVTYPPDDVHRMLAGMGVPDLLGTQGTYTLYSTSARAGGSGNTRFRRLRLDRNGQFTTAFEGPANPSDVSQSMTVPLTIAPEGTAIRFDFDDNAFTLNEGQWSDWIRIEFGYFGVLSVSGLVRVHVNRAYPQPEFYISPIQIDPVDPAVPISSPSKYSERLTERIGLYHTIGMPEETWSLNEGDLSDDAYLEMIRTTLAEREAMYYDALDRRDSRIVTAVFVQTDRVSHMFYRGIDPEHPLHAEVSETGRNAIAWIYQEADRIVGQTRARMKPGDRLMIVSDHGFAPFRKAVHLNRALVDLGYLKLKPGQSTSAEGFAAVDWSQSRAYALGLNGVFINQSGREQFGEVAPGATQALKKNLIRDLSALKDPATGEPLIRRLFDGATLYAGNANGDAPDIVVGYHAGYRASWQTTLGGVPGTLLSPNNSKWSGDHCIDPELVPGVVFLSEPDDAPPRSIRDVGQWILGLPLGG